MKNERDIGNFIETLPNEGMQDIVKRIFEFYEDSPVDGGLKGEKISIRINSYMTGSTFFTVEYGSNNYEKIDCMYKYTPVSDWAYEEGWKNSDNSGTCFAFRRYGNAGWEYNVGLRSVKWENEDELDVLKFEEQIKPT